eukprot:838101_1
MMEQSIGVTILAMYVVNFNRFISILVASVVGSGWACLAGACDPTNRPTNRPTKQPQPTTQPTMPPTEYCREGIDGGEWYLVRHVYNKWHPATDNLAGTDMYGTHDDNPLSPTSWSIPFAAILAPDGSTLFMFSNGDCSRWLPKIINLPITTHYLE